MLKLIDIFKFGPGEKGNFQEDMTGTCMVLYESVGGRKKSRGSTIIKSICCGLKKSLIKKKFKNATQLRVFLENTN